MSNLHIDSASVEAAIAEGAQNPASASTPGAVKQAAAVANCVPAADGTSAGTQLNALLASLRAAGALHP